MKSISKWSYCFVALSLVFGVGAWQSWQWWSWVISPPMADNPAITEIDEKIFFQIPSGTASQQIGVNLEK
ncbi:MAG: aminodeoxychorismate lyase, partial [Moorea sp. SIO2B7]|nr:aminodeoxychorismate lyase [Moorena sp. SIO2B7]